MIIGTKRTLDSTVLEAPWGPHHRNADLGGVKVKAQKALGRVGSVV